MKTAIITVRLGDGAVLDQHPRAASFIDVNRIYKAALVAAIRLHHEAKTGAASSQCADAQPADRVTLYKAALHDLENGKTCADRKAAIPTLVQLGDAKAIPALKKARYRMRGGVLGIGDNNTNACLKMDAETAIRDLGGQLK